MMTKQHNSSPRAHAVRAALGLEQFDVLLQGGEVLDVACGQLRHADVGIAGKVVAALLPPASRAHAQHVENIAGQVVAPGLFDSHMHVESSLISKVAYAAAALPHGITTIAWDPHDLANVMGAPGVLWAQATDASPMRVIVQVPSCVPSCPGLEQVGTATFHEQIAPLLANTNQPCLAEVMDMRAVLDCEPRMEHILAQADNEQALICGHARDLTKTELQAYAAAGIHTDHEITSGTDLLNKLQAGIGVELRGSHPHLLPEFVAALKSLPTIPATLTLCTDDVFPDELVANGGLAWLVAELIRLGLDPIATWRAATHNAALRYNLRNLGLVAAGKLADLVVVPDLATVQPSLVLCAGKVVARNGKLTVTVGARKPEPIPRALHSTVHVDNLLPAAFRQPTTGTGLIELDAIDQPRFTRWGKVVAEQIDGAIQLPAQALWMAVGHRHGQHPCDIQLAILTGWGTWQGAFATTFSHDAHNLTVFGTTAKDMCLAANRVIQAGGGMAVFVTGKELACLELPWAGLMATTSANVAGKEFTLVRQALAGIVTAWSHPMPVIKACVGASLVCNPGPRLSDVGIVDPITR